MNVTLGFMTVMRMLFVTILLAAIPAHVDLHSLAMEETRNVEVSCCSLRIIN